MRGGLFRVVNVVSVRYGSSRAGSKMDISFEVRELGEVLCGWPGKALGCSKIAQQLVHVCRPWLGWRS